MISTFFDPLGLGPIPQIPVVPVEVLERHQCYRQADSGFKSAARLLQSLWREDRGYPAGQAHGPDGKRQPLGSRLAPAIGRAGGGFLSREIGTLVRRELMDHEVGAMIDPEDVYLNLLSPQQLAFNLFGHLKLHRDLATAVFRRLLPGRDMTVEDIRFEYAPGPRGGAYESGSTAFDVLVRYSLPRGKWGFFAFEIKYAEGFIDPLESLKAHYAELARSSSLGPQRKALGKSRSLQLLRLQLVSERMLHQDRYAEGTLLLVGPEHNKQVQTVGQSHGKLAGAAAWTVGFRSITLEQIIAAIAEEGETKHARSLYRRYCDWWLVDGEIHLMSDETEESAPREHMSTGAKVLFLPTPPLPPSVT
jgi:hypothetical protein